MDRAVDLEPNGVRDLRVAIIGNSNSVMRESYVRALEADPRFDVVNKSIGSTPNVVLLDFLARETDIDYDFLIIETAVVDSIQGNSLYTLERSQETLQFFIAYVRARSRAQIIILTIPTRYGLLSPNAYWQEQLYSETARRFGIPILDGFRLVRRLLGSSKAQGVGRSTRRAEQLVSAFGLPTHLVPALAWRSLRDRNVASNALGASAFVDHAHLSYACHSLLGALLHAFISSVTRGRADRRFAGHPDAPPLLMVAQPIGGAQVARVSSLISRDLVGLRSGDSALYRCPPGYRAHGLLVNDPATMCFLQLRSPGGTTTFDMRLTPKAIDWIAVIVPVLDAVGDGDVTAIIVDEPETAGNSHCLHGTGPTCGKPRAEIGGLILLRTDWRDVIPPAEEAAEGALPIEDAPWAEPLIAEAAARADLVVRGMEADGRFVDGSCCHFVSDMLGQGTAGLSPADQARLMLVMGMTEQLTAFLNAALNVQAGSLELAAMQAALQAQNAEDEVPPGDLLDRSVALASAGALDEADALLAEGVARFPTEIGFFIERAWIPHRKKDWPEAIKRWQLVKDSFPQHPVGYRGLSICLRDSGRPGDAERLLHVAATRFSKLEPQL